MRSTAVALLAALLILTACSGGSKKHSTATGTTTTPSSTVAGASTASGAPGASTTTTTAAKGTTPTTRISGKGKVVPATTTRPKPVVRAAGISIQPGGAYSPASYTARPGGLVVVENFDKTPHTMVADDGSFSVGPMVPNVEYTLAAPLQVGPHHFHSADEPSEGGTLVVAS